MLGNLLGIDPAEIRNMLVGAQAQLAEAVSALSARMDALCDTQAATLKVLELEYGRPSRSLEGHDPAVSPRPVVLDVADANAADSMNMIAELGKPATRGHVTNIGDAKARLYWGKADRPEGTPLIGPYYLMPGTTLDLTWAVEVLEVRGTADGATSVQVLAQ